MLNGKNVMLEFNDLPLNTGVLYIHSIKHGLYYSTKMMRGNKCKGTKSFFLFLLPLPESCVYDAWATINDSLKSNLSSFSGGGKGFIKIDHTCKSSAQKAQIFHSIFRQRLCAEIRRKSIKSFQNPIIFA